MANEARTKHTVTPTPIFHAPQHRPIEGPPIQVIVDQFNGLTTNFSNIGLTNSIFSLEGIYTFIYTILQLHYFNIILMFRFFGTIIPNTWNTFSKFCH